MVKNNIQSCCSQQDFNMFQGIISGKSPISANSNTAGSSKISKSVVRSPSLLPTSPNSSHDLVHPYASPSRAGTKDEETNCKRGLTNVDQSDSAIPATSTSLDENGDYSRVEASEHTPSNAATGSVGTFCKPTFMVSYGGHSFNFVTHTLWDGLTSKGPLKRKQPLNEIDTTGYSFEEGHADLSRNGNWVDALRLKAGRVEQYKIQPQ